MCLWDLSSRDSGQLQGECEEALGRSREQPSRVDDRQEGQSKLQERTGDKNFNPGCPKADLETYQREMPQITKGRCPV